MHFFTPLPAARAGIPGDARPSRRSILKAAAAVSGTLLIGLHLPVRQAAGSVAVPPQPNAFIRIGADNTVTVVIKYLEMGQGVTTGLATIVAEELDADWSQMRTSFAPVDVSLYNHLAWGAVQGTGGSASIASSWGQLRRAGAAARHMLATAAAKRWGVPVEAIVIDRGVVAGGPHRASFGDLATDAARQPVPDDVRLKDPKAFRLIGTRLPRLDSPAKTDGSAVYAIDVRRPGMLTAVIRRPDRFGATLTSFDARTARAVPGVVEVVAVPMGIAVVARNSWAAIQGRDALAAVEWDETAAERRGTDDLQAEYRRLAGTSGRPTAHRGDAARAVSKAERIVEGEFTLPFLAHAPMEPLNCVIERTANGVTIWAGSQFQSVEQAVVARILDLKPEQVAIETVYAGGSFGRRATANADYLAEAAHILKAIGYRAPLHLLWTREDDIRGGFYRPLYHHKVRAGLDSAGRIAGWEHRIVGQSILAGTPFEPYAVKDGVDFTSVEGVVNLPYAIPDLTVDLHTVAVGVPVLWWRSVGNSHTAHVVEVMVDELAVAAGRDPIEFRLDLLKDHPRHLGVLHRLREASRWGQAPGPGRGRGVAIHEAFNTVVGCVVEVQVKDAALIIDKVVCAVDCGLAVNPDIVRAQIEGGIGLGLGAALRGEITLDKGVVEQANVDGYMPLRMSEMPPIEVHIVASGADPTGVGEPAVPVIAPALSNAVFQATGKRLRSLPLRLETASAR